MQTPSLLLPAECIHRERAGSIPAGKEALTSLLSAARDVIACWESGDLAAAVRRLDCALAPFRNGKDGEAE